MQINSYSKGYEQCTSPQRKDLKAEKTGFYHIHVCTLTIAKNPRFSLLMNDNYLIKNLTSYQLYYRL